MAGEKAGAVKRAIVILWPSFIVAGIGEIVFFTVFDPQELYLFGEPTQLSRLAVYSIGFFLCWAFAAASSAFTSFLQGGADEVNHSPPPAPRAREEAGPQDSADALR